MQQEKKVAELEQEKVWQQEKEIEKEEQLEQEKEDQLLENSEVMEKKKRREVIFELALFFVLGVLLGVTFKTEAVKRITIGFNDYQIAKPTQSYDVMQLKKDINEQIAKQQADQQALQSQGTPQQ